MISQLPLALETPDPRRLCRRSDVGGSVEAAVALVESGRESSQVLYTIGLVVSLPGRTSAELAEETREIGERLGYSLDKWRHVLGRRLSTAEDEGRGPIIGHQHSFNVDKPWRVVEPEIERCRVSPGSPRSIRWYAKGWAA